LSAVVDGRVVIAAVGDINTGLMLRGVCISAVGDNGGEVCAGDVASGVAGGDGVRSPSLFASSSSEVIKDVVDCDVVVNDVVVCVSSLSVMRVLSMCAGVSICVSREVPSSVGMSNDFVFLNFVPCFRGCGLRLSFIVYRAVLSAFSVVGFKRNFAAVGFNVCRLRSKIFPLSEISFAAVGNNFYLSPACYDSLLFIIVAMVSCTVTLRPFCDG
jgi:hypothetical protein